MTTRKSRGAETQRVVAGWYAERGWPFAESTGAGRPGIDITGMPGLAVEVKARRDFSPLTWLKQACGQRHRGLPFVVHRPDGMGPAALADWPVTMRLEDHTALLRAAGYGDSERYELVNSGVLVDEDGATAPVIP